MSTATHYPHLTLEDGVARIGNTRYKVLHLASEHYHHGWTAEELLRQHTDLRPEEVNRLLVDSPHRDSHWINACRALTKLLDVPECLPARSDM